MAISLGILTQHFQTNPFWAGTHIHIFHHETPLRNLGVSWWPTDQSMTVLWCDLDVTWWPRHNVELNGSCRVWRKLSILWMTHWKASDRTWSFFFSDCSWLWVLVCSSPVFKCFQETSKSLPSGKLTVWPWKSPFVDTNITHFPSPMTARVKLLI